MPFSSVGRRRFSTRVQTQSARRHPEALRLLPGQRTSTDPQRGDINY